MLGRASSKHAAFPLRRCAHSMGVVNLNHSMFTNQVPSTALVEHSKGTLRAKLFTYPSGVAAIELENDVGAITILPYQGQQVWDASFHGRRLTMKSMYEMPRPVELSKQWSYIDTYGSFFVHCGATSMGCPMEADDHPVHGELPNAPYQKAHIGVGSDTRGDFLEVGGIYDHTVAFTCNFRATATIRLYAGESTFPISMHLKNNFHDQMDLMYMAHTNFKPIAGSQLVYTHADGPADLEVGGSVNGLVPPSKNYLDFLDELQSNPSRHNDMDEAMVQSINPEVLVYLRSFKADSEGLAHSMQLLPGAGGGGADYVAHKPDQLPLATRWMVHDGSQSALGLTLPATAEPAGKAAETEKGNLQYIAAGAERLFEVEVGALDAAAAASKQSHIQAVLATDK